MSVFPLRIVHRFNLVIIVCLLCSPLLGQVENAGIQGLVQDQQGAVVPGAEVTARNIQTNRTFSAVTNDQGFYRLTTLLIGEYEVRASLPGFKTAVRTGVTLDVEQIARIDLTLEVGEIAEEVVVIGTTPLLESESSTVGQVIKGKAVTDLPLNGREYVQLARLSAGVLDPPPGDRGGASGFIANGVRGTFNDFSLDGIDNNARTPGMQQRTYDVVRPSVDAIGEFKVETHNFSAEFGRAAGAVINATVKSGGNEFHGSVFEFHRNDDLDARDFFSPADQPKPLLIRNQFGGTIGGPVVRDKAFFFFSYEGLRERRGFTDVRTLPTEAMQRGDFSSDLPIFDPATTRPNPDGPGFIRDPFLNNVIPADRIDPIAKRLTDLLPGPNQPGKVNNFVLSPTRKFDNTQYIVRIDTNLGEKDKLFGRWVSNDRDQVRPPPFDPPLLGSTDSNFSQDKADAHSLAIGETHTFNPSVLNELRLGYTRLNANRAPFVDEQLFQEFGFKGINPPASVTGLPHININRFTALGEATFLPNQKIPETFEIKDNVSFIRGNHSIKTGFTFRTIRVPFNISGAARGNFSFNGDFTQDPQNRKSTGSEFADFLLGIPSSSSLETVFEEETNNRYWGFFVLDNWKVTAKLTLNWGLRYELFFPDTADHDRQSNFLIGPNKLIFPDNKIPEGLSTKARALIMDVPEDIGSRTLMKLDKNNFGPRIGLAYRLADQTVVRAGGGIFYAEGLSTILGGAGRLVGNAPFSRLEQFPTDRINPVVTFASGFPPDALSGVDITPQSALRAFDPDLPTAYVTHWNLSIQHDLPEWFLVDITYNGSKGTQLTEIININNRRPGPGSVASRRPIKGFGNINFVSGLDNSIYHGLTIKAERRFSKGLTFLLNYTLGKAISAAEQQFTGNPIRDPLNVFAERGRTAFDVRQRFVGSFLWEIPFGTGHHRGFDNPWLNGILGNWQVNGILTLQTGPPFTPGLSFSPANNGDNRPDRVGDGKLPDGERSINQWFDKSAFAPSPDFVLGNAGRNILDGPGQRNLDFSIFKNVPFPQLGEQGEVQFRVEFFNAFNHPQFSNPNTLVDRPQGGRITSLRNNMREVQVGLKILF